jgi:DNA-binding LacI/PurR family transcriptional regulator
VFVSSDTVAMGAMRAAKRQGYSIPEDISFVGFDDIPMAIYHDPPLTTIRLPAYGIGWAAADLLIRLIDQEEVRQHKILLESELIVRDSCIHVG